MHSYLTGIYAQKNKCFVITKCNRVVLNYAGFKSYNQVLGKTDEDFCWAEYAPYYKKHEQDALCGNHYSTIIPFKNYKGDFSLFLHTKVSRMDQEKQEKYIVCHAHQIVNPDVCELISVLYALKDKQKPIYTIGKKDYCVSLSARERQCLFYLIYGKTAKIIAKILCLSSRTVEYYIDNIKSKFGCRTKAELIDKAIVEGYLEQLPKLSSPRELAQTLKA